MVISSYDAAYMRYVARYGYAQISLHPNYGIFGILCEKGILPFYSVLIPLLSNRIQLLEQLVQVIKIAHDLNFPNLIMCNLQNLFLKKLFEPTISCVR